MLVPPEVLIDGAVRTLLEFVLPNVSTPFARGQLYAVVDVRRNLRDRVEEKAALLDAEASSAAAALARVVATLGTARGSRVADALARAPAAPAADRVAALRAAFVVALETIDALPDIDADAVRAPILQHLADQAL